MLLHLGQFGELSNATSRNCVLGPTQAIITCRNRSLELIRNRSLAQHRSSLSCGGCADEPSGPTGIGGEELHKDRKQLRNRSLVLVRNKLELVLEHNS
jgi:hypothetical protein